MARFNFFSRPVAILAVVCVVLASCDDDNDAAPDLRPNIEYTALENTTPYSEQFMDESGVTTVDLTSGNTLHKMFQALNYKSSSSVSANTEISAATLKNLYSNTGNAFTDISTSTISVTGADLNNSTLNLKELTASSLPAAEATVVRNRLEEEFETLATASLSVTQTASAGQAGKLGNYLVTEKGIESVQIIQKSLIGALQLDYIGNVLMNTGLEANNSQLVTGENYTQLEHNWDEAYGLLTLNAVYLYDTADNEASTDAARATVEFALGSYIWEYNKTGYAQIFPAFLKGRAAIVNNDRAALEEQATFIRTQIEKAIARAAVGYLAKWKDAAGTDATRAHAMGEGLGFIYSLRFAGIHGGDAAFSDEILDDLIGSENGFWDLTVDKINAAQDAINAKFSL